MMKRSFRRGLALFLCLLLCLSLAPAAAAKSGEASRDTDDAVYKAAEAYLYASNRLPADGTDRAAVLSGCRLSEAVETARLSRESRAVSTASLSRHPERTAALSVPSAGS